MYVVGNQPKIPYKPSFLEKHKKTMAFETYIKLVRNHMELRIKRLIKDRENKEIQRLQVKRQILQMALGQALWNVCYLLRTGTTTTSSTGLGEEFLCWTETEHSPARTRGHFAVTQGAVTMRLRGHYNNAMLQVCFRLFCRFCRPLHKCCKRTVFGGRNLKTKLPKLTWR